MSAETHITNFVREIEDAYKEAMGAVDNLKQKVDAFKHKAATMSPELRAAIGTPEQESTKPS